MRVPSTVGQPRRQRARLEILVPTSDGEVRIESWEYQNIDELREQLEHGPGAIYPHMLCRVYEGDVLVAVRFPQWVEESDEKLKSPRQIAWDKLSEKERLEQGRLLALALIGLKLYDPDRLKITFGGKEIGAEGFADARIVASNSMPAACAKCEGTIEAGDECVYVKGIAYCPMCAGTFGPDEQP